MRFELILFDNKIILRVCKDGKYLKIFNQYFY